jgi:ABC-2 type transport system permease protein
MNTLTALSPEHAPDDRLLPAVWKLLLLRVRITFNSFRHATLRRKIGTIFVWLLILAFAVFLVTMSWLLLKFIRSPELTQYLEIDPAPLLAAIPVLILTGLFLGILLTSFGVLLQALYLSGDMDFLLATPVPIRAVFVAKLLQAVLPNFALVSLFGLPVLFGLGFSGGYNILYYPLILLTMIVLALAAAGLSSLLVMLVVRILPPRRAAEILGFLGATIGFTCSQMGNLSNSFSNEMDISGAQVSGLLLRANTPWLPLNWAGQGLIALGEGHWLTGLPLVGLTLGLSTAAFWFALVTAERWYYSGWAGMQVIERKKKPIRTHQSSAAEQENGISRLARLLPAPVWGIVWKDFLTLRRDLRSLSQLITPLIMGVIYTLILFRNGGEPPAGRGEAPAWFMDALGLMMSYSSVGMSLFVGWVLLSRLAGLGFSHEGKNYWMVKTSPVSTSQLLAAKFLVAYLPGLGLGLVFLIVIAFLQKMALFGFFYSLVTIVMCLAGLTGIQLSFGVLGANFTWDDPRKMNAGGMGCLGQLLTIIYLPVAFGLFIAPLGLVGLFGIAPMYGYLAGLVIGSSLAVGCAYLPLWLVRKRVEHLDEV